MFRTRQRGAAGLHLVLLAAIVAGQPGLTVGLDPHVAKGA
jgi:hypothetical protein